MDNNFIRISIGYVSPVGPQIPGGICNCGFYRLKADGNHSDPYGGKARR